MEVKILNDIEEYYDEVSKSIEPYYLLELKDNNTINNFLENGGIKIKSSKLINLKLAYNLNFNGYLQKKDDQSKIDVSNIYDVLDNLDYNYKDTQRLIIDFDTKGADLNDNQKKLFMDIIQQFIFLKLDDLDILTNQELKNNLIYNNFNSNVESLKKDLLAFEIKVLKYNIKNNDIEKEKQEILERVGNLSKLTSEIEEKKLTISVVALRGGGKSVIVNSFLGEEFAPTSLEDSTPTAVYYESWEKPYIEVKIVADQQLENYKTEKLLKFNKAPEVYDFLKEEFDKANNSEAKYMPNIYIKFPGKLDYIMVDTPGPNKETHQDIATQCIKESDAVILAIEYGDNEEKNAVALLEKVQQTLKQENKLHSLVVVANKLDLMYQNEHSKSTVRYLDKSINYLKEKNLPIVMMATSALEYFYMIQYLKLLESNNKSIDSSLVDKLLKKLDIDDLNDKETTIRMFIKNQKGNLEDFHRIQDVTIEDIYKHSNMPTLIKRIEYIAQNKVFEEKFANKFKELDDEFVSLSNNFLAERIEKLKTQKREILEKLDEISAFFKNKNKDVKNQDKNTKLTLESLDIAYDDINKAIHSSVIKFFDTFEEDILYDTSDKTNNLFIGLDELMPSIDNFQKTFKSTIEYMNDDLNNIINKLEVEIIELNNEIQKFIKSKQIKDKYGLDISLSHLDPKLHKEELKFNYTLMENELNKFHGQGYSVFESDFISYKKKIEIDNVIDFKQKPGIINTLKAYIPYLNPDMEAYDVEIEKIVQVKDIDRDKLRMQLNKYKAGAIETISENIHVSKIKIKDDIDGQFDEIKTKIRKELDNVIDNYSANYKKIAKIFRDDKKTTQDKIKFYNSIKDEFQSIHNRMDIIRGVS